MDATDYIEAHSLFYRKNYRRLLTLGIILSVLTYLLLALIFYQYKNRPIVKYFATTSNGQLIEIYPSK